MTETVFRFSGSQKNNLCDHGAPNKHLPSLNSRVGEIELVTDLLASSYKACKTKKKTWREFFLIYWKQKFWSKLPQRLL